MSRRQTADGRRQPLDVIATVAHQLRGPVGGMRFAAAMLRHGDYGKLPARAKQVIKQIESSADRLLDLAETALNAARLEAGVFQTLVTDVDVKAELALLLAEVKTLAESKKLKLTATFKKMPRRVTLDREVLRNVVFNLLDNAIKYTDDGRVTLACRTRGRHLIITVTDTGAGLTRAEMRVIFKRFHRGQHGSRAHHDGAGLGLYVVKQLLAATHGRVGVTSRGLSHGSTFTVEMPFTAADT